MSGWPHRQPGRRRAGRGGLLLSDAPGRPGSPSGACWYRYAPRPARCLRRNDLARRTDPEDVARRDDPMLDHYVPVHSRRPPPPGWMPGERPNPVPLAPPAAGVRPPSSRPPTGTGNGLLDDCDPFVQTVLQNHAISTGSPPMPGNCLRPGPYLFRWAAPARPPWPSVSRATRASNSTPGRTPGLWPTSPCLRRHRLERGRGSLPQRARPRALPKAHRSTVSGAAPSHHPDPIRAAGGSLPRRFSCVGPLPGRNRGRRPTG